ncbi:MAG: hypothetical protein KDA24_07650 [Deltaproteobacteria bacterium]|nr:hypothetical protein [Deltaproteobacteria bacterium]
MIDRPAQRLLPTLLLMLALLVPSSAYAVDGLSSLGLTWGMTVEEVKGAHTTKYEKEPKSQPDGTVAGRLLLTQDVEMFGERLEVALYFSVSGLSIIRLQYRKPDNGDAKKLVDWYQPHWGEALYTSERKRGRKNKTWAWPWEGVEIREVVEDGDVRYARADFSAAVSEEWSRSDAMLCSLLPSTTGCPFAETTCPQQDSTFADGKKAQPWSLLGSTGEVTCTYTGYRLQEMRLTFDSPNEKTAKWLRQLLVQRIGSGMQDRDENSQKVKIQHDWPTHSLNLLIYRKSVTQLKDGSWTGPAERIRLKRTMAAPSDQPEETKVIEPPK